MDRRVRCLMCLLWISMTACGVGTRTARNPPPASPSVAPPGASPLATLLEVIDAKGHRPKLPAADRISAASADLRALDRNSALVWKMSVASLDSAVLTPDGGAIGVGILDPVQGNVLFRVDARGKLAGVSALPDYRALTELDIDSNTALLALSVPDALRLLRIGFGGEVLAQQVVPAQGGHLVAAGDVAYRLDESKQRLEAFQIDRGAIWIEPVGAPIGQGVQPGLDLAWLRPLSGGRVLVSDASGLVELHGPKLGMGWSFGGRVPLSAVAEIEGSLVLMDRNCSFTRLDFAGHVRQVGRLGLPRDKCSETQIDPWPGRPGALLLRIRPTSSEYQLWAIDEQGAPLWMQPLPGALGTWPAQLSPLGDRIEIYGEGGDTSVSLLEPRPRPVFPVTSRVELSVSDAVAMATSKLAPSLGSERFTATKTQFPVVGEPALTGALEIATTPDGGIWFRDESRIVALAAASSAPRVIARSPNLGVCGWKCMSPKSTGGGWLLASGQISAVGGDRFVPRSKLPVGITALGGASQSYACTSGSDAASPALLGGIGFEPIPEVPRAGYVALDVDARGTVWLAGAIAAVKSAERFWPLGEGLLVAVSGRTHERYRVATGPLLAISAAADESVWAAGIGGGLIRVTARQSERWVLEPALHVHAVFARRADDVWFAGEQGMLLHFDGKDLLRVPLLAREAPDRVESSAAIRSLAPDGSDGLWAVGSDGIWRIARR